MTGLDTAPLPGRQTRAVRNDERILDAATRLTAEEGWAVLVPSRVAAASGLSRSTVQERFADRSSLGAAVWERRCGRPIQLVLADAIAALTTDVTPQSRASSIAALAGPSIELQAASELLITAHYDATVRDSIIRTLGAIITDLLGGRNRARSGRTAYLLAFALGAMLAGRRSGAESINWTPISEALAAAAAEGRAPGSLPKATAPHFTGDLDLAPDDPPLNALLNAALREIGSHGFEGASVDRIARASHHTKGLVFSRFPSKLELFLEATRRQQSLAFAANEGFMQDVTDTYGRGVAEAVTIREIQRPHLDYSRAIAMEQLRLTWHYPELKAAQEADLDAVVEQLAATDDSHFAHSAAVVQFAFATGLGMALLPLLYPNAYRLPYDVMTIPLVDMGL